MDPDAFNQLFDSVVSGLSEVEKDILGSVSQDLLNKLKGIDPSILE